MWKPINGSTERQVLCDLIYGGPLKSGAHRRSRMMVTRGWGGGPLEDVVRRGKIQLGREKFKGYAVQHGNDS